PMRAPRKSIWQLRRHVLAEQACDVRAWGRQRVVQGRGDDQLDDRLATPSRSPRVAIGAIHIVETRPEDDSRRVMIGAIAPRQRSETRQLRKCQVNTKRS